MAKVKTIKDTAIKLYNEKYSIDFISEFLGTDIMTVKSWVFKDDPKKQFKNIAEIPNKKISKEKLAVVPAIKSQFAEDMPAIIKGLTLVGYSLKQISDNMQISEESLTEIVENISDIAEAYNYAKNTINIKVAETLFSAIMPRELHEKTFKVEISEDGSKKKVLTKEVIKEYAGNVEGLFKWLEVNVPEKWNTKTKGIMDLLRDCGVMLVPEDDNEEDWTKSAKEQQSVLVEVIEDEKRRIDDEYKNEE